MHGKTLINLIREDIRILKCISIKQLQGLRVQTLMTQSNACVTSDTLLNQLRPDS